MTFKVILLVPFQAPEINPHKRRTVGINCYAVLFMNLYEGPSSRGLNFGVEGVYVHMLDLLRKCGFEVTSMLVTDVGDEMWW